VANPPAGLTVRGGHVPANATTGFLTLSQDGKDGQPPRGAPVFLAIEGRGSGNGQVIRRRAEQQVVLGREAEAAASVLTLTHFAVGLAAPEPFTVQGPATVEAVLGYPTPVAVSVTRAAMQSGPAVAVTGVLPAAPAAPGQAAPPPPLAFKPETVAPGATKGSFTITPAVTAPVGTVDLVPQGQAKVNNADRAVSGPAVAVTVLRPFVVDLLTPSLSLVPGQTIALKGRLQRQPVFKEPVQLKLEGLPKGVTLAAPAQMVAGKASDFAIDLKVDSKAAAASPTLTLTCSTTIAGTVYAHPPVKLPAQVKIGK
jgi:hypothetical protein